MKYLLTLIASFVFILDGNCQENTNSFNNTIKTYIKKYSLESNIAFENKDLEKGQNLFDSLVTKHLVGKTFEDYTLKSFKKRKLKLSSFKKPLFILTYATWCVPSKGEIPALNKLAQNYAN